MTENSPVSVSEEARLDEITERSIALVVEVVSFASFGTGGKDGIDEATNALRKRIRSLIEEARIDGARPFILGTKHPLNLSR